MKALTLAIFAVILALTLYITWWAAKRTRTTSEFYAAGGALSARQNGFALAGDWMSAAAFLGFSGLIALYGMDGSLYAVAALAAFLVILLLIAEPMRNTGRYTLGDVIAYRMQTPQARLAAVVGTIVVNLAYMIPQMAGAGALMKLILGIPYETAVVLVGIGMIVYVLFGGMIATTWVQIIKAVMLLFGTSFMAFMVLKHFGFSTEAMFAGAAAVHAKGSAIMAPGGLLSNPIDAISLGVGMMFGTAGLPHILMRFFTVSDAKEARKSVFYATGFIGYFYLLLIVVGFGAIVMVGTDPTFRDANGAIIGGGNMIAVHLAQAVGGNLFLGFISAVAFATILAVVAGLALSGASAVSHDLYACVMRKGQATEQQEIRVSRIATLCIGVLAIILGLLFESQNIAFLSGLVLAIAASVNFPVLFLSMYWKGLTTRGAVIGSLAGLVSAIVLLVLSPAVWVNVLHYDKALFPYSNPALFSMSLAFFSAWLFSVTDTSPRAALERGRYLAQFIRSMTGIGAAGASKH